jgi:hypothetical protein
MSVYIDTTGNSVLSVAVCDRCNRKFAYVDLMPDPNFPGMRVCKDDLDNFDPWRLPARQTENISLRFPRPDVSVATQPLGGNQLLTENGFQNNNSIFVTGEGNYAGSTGDLNLNSVYEFFPSSTIPTLYSISPTNGPKTGGTFVTITGTNFINITNITLGGANIPSFNIVSPTEITMSTPVYSITGLVDLSVFSTFGTSTLHGAFTYT